MKTSYFIKMLILLGAALGITWLHWDALHTRLKARLSRHTVKSRLVQFEHTATKRLKPHLTQAGFDGLPKHLLFVAFKTEKQLHVFGKQHKTHQWKKIRQYPILAASGVIGPKLREGDYQVPEGFYLIEGLNPNSSYHVSMRVNYPSPADWKQARLDGRKQPGSDIYIHGKALSAGCLAMGDPVSEELFVLTAKARQHGPIELWISPMDFRTKTMPETLLQSLPDWVSKRYRQLISKLKPLPD